MKKFLLAFAGLAIAGGAVAQVNELVTPTGTKTEFCPLMYQLVGFAKLQTYDAELIYDYYTNDDGTFYIRNFVNGKGYFKGTLNGSTITVPVPQAVYEEDGVTYYVKTANWGDSSGDALLDEQFTMSYYPANGKININAYGVGIYAGDNTNCERAVSSCEFYSDKQYSEPFALARIAETDDGQTLAEQVTARYLLAKDPDFMVVNGMFPGSNSGQMIDDWGSKWRFTDIQYIGTSDDNGPIFTAMLNGNYLTNGYRTFTKTVNGDITEWNMDEGQEIIAWYMSGEDSEGTPTSNRWRTVTSLKLTSDLSELPTTAVDEVKTQTEAVEVARYNLAGQRVDAATGGVVIIKMSDGTAHKVIVK